MQTAQTTRIRSCLLIAFITVLMLAMLIPLPPTYRNGWIAALVDLAHIPVFALVALALNRLGLSPARILSIAVLLVALTEGAQLLTGRHAALGDLCRGFAGLSLGMALCWSKSTTPPVLRASAVGLAAALCLVTSAEAYPTLSDSLAARRSFPVLSDFSSSYEARRWYQHNAVLTRAKTANGQPCGELLLLPDDTGDSGVVLFPVVRDWSRFDALICEFSFSGEPLKILLSIRDGRKLEEPLTRFDDVRHYDAGTHRVAIRLNDVQAGVGHAPVYLARVESFHFAATGLRHPRTVELHRVYLN